MSNTFLEAKQTKRLPDNEFGPKHTEPIPYNVINKLKQVRTDFPPEAIVELAESMVKYDESGNMSFDMHNPLIVGRYTPEAVIAYLNDYMQYYGLQETPNLIVAPDGYIYILIAGERRTRAIEYNIEKYELPADNVYIRCVIKDAISFIDAKSSQISENTHDRPTHAEEAKEINLMYRYLTNIYPERTITYAEIGRRLGKSPDIVRNALRFVSMPDSVQRLATTKEVPVVKEKGTKERVRDKRCRLLTYSQVVAMYPLLELYAKKYINQLVQESDTTPDLQDPQMQQDIKEYVDIKIKTFVDTLLKLKIKNNLVSELINNEIRLQISILRNEQAYPIESLLQYADDIGGLKEIQLEGQRARRRLAITAIAVLIHDIENGGGDDPHILAAINGLNNIIKQKKKKKSKGKK